MMPQIARRQFILMAGGTAVAWPLLSRAQQGKRIARIGVLLFGTPDTDPNLPAFLRGLRDLGYVEAQNIVIEYRYAGGKPDRLRGLAGELVAIKPDLIFALGGDVAPSVRAATSTIPIVMAAVGEALGVVESLARPGGNVTGLSAFTTELAGKRVEFAKELLPGMARVAFVHNMSNPVAPPQWEQTRIAARQLAIEAELLDVRNGDEIGRAIEAAVSKRIDALLVGNDSVTQENRALIADLAARKRLPTVYGSKEFVEAGGLISYAVSYQQLYFRAARFVDRILKGAKAGDLLVEQPTKFELVINLKAAKAIGLTILESFLARADEVIE